MVLLRLPHLIALLSLALGAQAQRPASKQFQWKWRNDVSSPSLTRLGDTAVENLKSDADMGF